MFAKRYDIRRRSPRTTPKSPAFKRLGLSRLLGYAAEPPTPEMNKERPELPPLLLLGSQADFQKPSDHFLLLPLLCARPEPVRAP